MRVGIGIGLNYQRPSFNSATLFSVPGSRGFFYDFSDYSTQFTDTAGTTGVTGVGQSLALVLDESQGLAAGPELRGGGVVSTVGSPGTLATFSTSTGAGSAYRLDGSNVSAVQIPVTDNRVYLIDVEQLTGSLQIRGSGPAGTILVSSVVGRQTYRISVPAGEDLFFTTGVNAAGTTFTVNSVREIPGNHATQATAGNRPLTTTIGTGFRGIQFDGVDDFLQTAAIDFSNSDKMTVVAGVRKLSDAARAMLVELGPPAATGTFRLEAPSAASPNYFFLSTGTASAGAGPVVTYAAPISNVVSGLSDISGDLTTIRINGTQAAQSTADQGTGNYANDIIYIGRRGGTTLPFNGILTFLCVINRTLTAAELAQLEAFANGKTGAY